MPRSLRTATGMKAGEIFSVLYRQQADDLSCQATRPQFPKRNTKIPKGWHFSRHLLIKRKCHRRSSLDLNQVGAGWQFLPANGVQDKIS